MFRKFFLLTAVFVIVVLVVGVSVRPRRPATRDRAQVILCLGDSMTEGDYGGYPVYLRRLMKSEAFRVRIVSAARPGHNTREYAAFLRGSDILRKFRPDIALLMLGTNDVRTDGDRSSLDEFRREMSRIVEMIRGAGIGKYRGADAIFIATVPPVFSIDLPNFSEESKRRIVEEINPEIRRLARERNLLLVDLERLFMANRDRLPGIHPDTAGYRLMAEMFFTAIRPGLRPFPAD